MSSTKNSLVFFGSSTTSLEALEALSKGFLIEAIITKQGSDLETWSKLHKAPCFSPSNRRELDEVFSAHDFRSKVGVVVDYGIIISKGVLEYFSMGLVNSHFSLLPKHRGADPIRSSILAGDSVTGITIMQVSEGMDEGSILAWSEVDISDDLNALDLRHELTTLNNSLLPAVLSLYLEDSISPIEQDQSAATYTKKVQKSDGLLDPTKSKLDLEREIRAYAGWPGSHLLIQNTLLTVKKAKASSKEVEPGLLVTINKGLFWGCKGGSLEILQIQPAGKRQMDAQSFINGHQALLKH